MCFGFEEHTAKYHGIIGVAVDDVAGGGDEVWEQAFSKLKRRFTFGHWEVEKGKFSSREVVQAAERERKGCYEIGAWSSHTHLALPVCKIPVDHICFCVSWGCQWWKYTC